MMSEITVGDLQYCFFTNGGAETNEMVIKLARIATNWRWYIAAINGFHGKSMAAISLGGKSTYRTPYLPMAQQGVRQRRGHPQGRPQPHPHRGKVPAVVLEPIQSEEGIIIPPQAA